MKLAIAALLGAINAYQLNQLQHFATGMNGDEDLGQDIIMKGDKFHYQQGLAQAAAREGSGVRARWIELPDCPYGGLPANQIALRTDLSNAIIATCKSWAGPNSVAPTPPPPATPATTPAVDVKVYDAVIKATGVTIPDHQHQVTQQEEGEIDPTGDGGADSPVIANAPQRTAWNADPEKIPGYLQLEETRAESKLWVELPDCSGAADEVALADDVSNATIATCKPRP